jgi:hypothetical protein
MQPREVHNVLKQHIPGLIVTNPDFSVERNNCKIEFFCTTTTTLDFTVTPRTSGGPLPAGVAVLTREAQWISDVLLSRLKKAEFGYCKLEDKTSKSNLLSWIAEPRPLLSRPAKYSYIICGILLAVAAILSYIMMQQPSGDTRTDNVILLLLAICLPAATLPLPFFFEHLKSRGKKGRWVYLEDGRELS